MKSATVNLRMTLGDKMMMREAMRTLECASITELVIEVMRRECKYPVLDRTGQVIEVQGEIPRLEIAYPQDDSYKQDVIQSVGMEQWERDKIYREARFRKFPGSPTFIMDTLRKKGFISSVVETTGRIG